MKNDTRIHHCGQVPDLTHLSLKVGSKQIRKALTHGCVKSVYLSCDADPAVTEPIEAMCLELGIQPVWVESMRSLGKACGIEVGAAAAAVTGSIDSDGISRGI